MHRGFGQLELAGDFPEAVSSSTKFQDLAGVALDPWSATHSSLGPGSGKSRQSSLRQANPFLFGNHGQN